MGILSTIFGGGDVISKSIDLIDSFHTSEPEAIAAKTKAKTDIMAAYAPFKIAQRYLALMFGGTYISSYILVMVMVFMGKDVADIRGVIAEFQIDWIMLSIVSFYFMGGLAEGIINKRKP